MYERNTGKGMTVQEYTELLQYIEKNHSWKINKGKHVKYIDATYDFRVNEYFAIELRGFFNGSSKEFVIVNENKDKNLKEWIYDWLQK